MLTRKQYPRIEEEQIEHPKLGCGYYHKKTDGLHGQPTEAKKNFLNVPSPNKDPILVLERFVIAEINVARVQTRQTGLHDLCVSIAHAPWEALSSESAEPIFCLLSQSCWDQAVTYFKRRREQLGKTVGQSRGVVFNETFPEANFQ
jgi:hypothetical protein